MIFPKEFSVFTIAQRASAGNRGKRLVTRAFLPDSALIVGGAAGLRVHYGRRRQWNQHPPDAGRPTRGPAADQGVCPTKKLSGIGQECPVTCSTVLSCHWDRWRRGRCAPPQHRTSKPPPLWRQRRP